MVVIYGGSYCTRCCKVYMHSAGCVPLHNTFDCISIGASAGAIITTLRTGRCARDVPKIMDGSLM